MTEKTHKTTDGSKLQLTRRRVLGGSIVLGLTAAGAGAGTFALFSDTETSSGNTIQAGTLDLGLGVTSGSFTAGNLKPTESISGSFDLTESGTITGNHVELDFSVNTTEAGASNDGDTAPSSAAGMEELFQVTTLDYDGTDLLSAYSVTDANSNGIVDLNDVVTHGVFDDLAAPGGSTLTLTIEATFVDAEGGTYTGGLDDDDFQGDELEIIVDAALAQESSQDIL